MSRTTDYAAEVLRLMIERAKDGIYEGRTTELTVDAKVPPSYYGKVFRVLEGSGAAEQVQRGGGSALSKWRILNPEADLAEPEKEAKTRRRDHDARLKDLEANLGGVNVPQALATLQGDINWLKRRLTGDAPDVA